MDLLFRNADLIKKKAEIGILREEAKLGDIRKSVLFTGKINVKKNNNIGKIEEKNSKDSNININEDDSVKVETIK